MSRETPLMTRMINVLSAMWQWLTLFFSRRSDLILGVMTEGMLPGQLKPKTLYVVTEDGMAWQAALICPCGCGEQLDLNLLADERPCWRVAIAPNGAASLHPSVWRTEGCRSHFFLREGHIVWAH